MAYICMSDDPTRVRETFVYQGLVHGITGGVGYDPDAGPATYYFAALTSPVRDTIEFQFCIHVVNNSTSAAYPIYDTIEANAIIPKEHRPCVATLLYTYSQKLIARTMPVTFFMETWNINLPAKALVKYDNLCHVFGTLGYTAAVGVSETPGKHLWVMNR